ncbi:hypothetical protein GWK47_035538 [Chionoecetes opilio]|uniref:Uncharacterized protein n=1 Tax=Chionoecetes opilio TaxID=41210 RepID=A0A8J4YN62_CHIOP|nr:hypothetical protein GWK47_035538 [Chionoecetes opilio]
MGPALHLGSEHPISDDWPGRDVRRAAGDGDKFRRVLCLAPYLAAQSRAPIRLITLQPQIAGSATTCRAQRRLPRLGAEGNNVDISTYTLQATGSRAAKKLSTPSGGMGDGGEATCIILLSGSHNKPRTPSLPPRTNCSLPREIMRVAATMAPLPETDATHPPFPQRPRCRVLYPFKLTLSSQHSAPSSCTLPPRTKHSPQTSRRPSRHFVTPKSRPSMPRPAPQGQASNTTLSPTIIQLAGSGQHTTLHLQLAGSGQHTTLHPTASRGGAGRTYRRGCLTCNTHGLPTPIPRLPHSRSPNKIPQYLSSYRSPPVSTRHFDGPDGTCVCREHIHCFPASRYTHPSFREDGDEGRGLVAGYCAGALLLCPGDAMLCAG